MTDPHVLWDSDEAAVATGGTNLAAWTAAGVSIDTRSATARRSLCCPARPEPRWPRLCHGGVHPRRRGGDCRAAAVGGAGSRAAPHRRGHLRGPERPRQPRPQADRRAHLRHYRQRRQDRGQGGASLGTRPPGADRRQRRQPQQPLGAAAKPRANGCRRRLWRVRDGHEPRRRADAAVAPDPPARCRDHHGRGGAQGSLQLRGCHRRRQGRDFHRRRKSSRGGRRGRAQSRQSALRAPARGGRTGGDHPDRRLRPPFGGGSSARRGRPPRRRIADPRFGVRPHGRLFASPHPVPTGSATACVCSPPPAPSAPTSPEPPRDWTRSPFPTAAADE